MIPWHALLSTAGDHAASWPHDRPDPPPPADTPVPAEPAPDPPPPAARVVPITAPVNRLPRRGRVDAKVLRILRAAADRGHPRGGYRTWHAAHDELDVIPIGLVHSTRRSWRRSGVRRPS